MALSDEVRDNLRKDMANELVSFILDPSNKKKILLLQPPQGVGKTITTALELFPRDDIVTVFLSYNHAHLTEVEKNENLMGFELLHLKGPNKPDDLPLCANLNEHRLFSKYGINLHQVLCNKHRCEDFEGCKYLEQFEILKEKNKSWVGMHSHLNTPIIKDFIERISRTNKPVCIVIDENPISNLTVDHQIIPTDLANIKHVIKETLISKMPKYVQSVVYVLDSLVRIIDVTQKMYEQAMTKEEKDEVGINGIRFFHEFIDGIETSYRGKFIENIKSKEMDIFVELYEAELLNIFKTRDKDNYAKNILRSLIEIARKCIDYYEKDIMHDICLPFYTEVVTTKRKDKEYPVPRLVFTKISRNLPNVPIVILDATGDKKFYQQMFKREVDSYKSDIEINRNIYQIMDGMYYATSFYYEDLDGSRGGENTRERVYDVVRSIVNYHHKKGDGKVNIVTMKRYSTKNEEEGKYIGKSIERYLKDHGVDMNNVRIRHYGSVRGKNEMEKDRVIILVGTFEPNHYDVKKKVSCWYEGEPAISNKRIIEPEYLDDKKQQKNPFYGHPYRYKDKRYAMYVKQLREHEIEQDIERIRHINSKGEKVAYLFSMLPIGFETKKTTIDTILLDLCLKDKARFRPHITFLDTLYTGRGKKSHKSISDKIRHLQAIKEAGGVEQLVNDLLGWGFIVSTGKRKKRVYQFTDTGKDWYDGIKKDLLEVEKL